MFQLVIQTNDYDTFKSSSSSLPLPLPILKALVASQYFNVPLDIVFDTHTNTTGTTTTYKLRVINDTDKDNNENSNNIEIIGNDTDIGNSFAIAIASSSFNKDGGISNSNYLYQTIEIDEWCEWENVTSATSNKYQYLNDTLLTKEISYHIVGSTMTIADIVILLSIHTTVNTIDTTDLPIAVQSYYNTHRELLIKYSTVSKELLDNAIEKQKTSTSTTSSSRSISTTSTSTDIDFTNGNETRLLHIVTTIFLQTIYKLFGNNIQLPDHILKLCSNSKHGDYQCSAAMPLFALLKSLNLTQEYKNPPAVGQAIINEIGMNHTILMDLSIQGPGFVLCRIRPLFLQQYITKIVYNYHTNTSTSTSTISPDNTTTSSTGTTTTTTTTTTNKTPVQQFLPIPAIGINKICLVDFSSPNIAKEMHVGHLRSTIIGECVCRILESASYTTVHRVNHVGDWGTQFGMLIQYLLEEYPSVVNNTNNSDTIELPNITDLTVFYKNAKQRFDDDPIFKKQSQLNVVNLQSNDPICIKIWNMLCDISRKEFIKVYNRLDVSVYEYGESFYNTKIPDVITEFTNAGLITISDGNNKQDTTTTTGTSTGTTATATSTNDIETTVEVMTGGAKCVFLGDNFNIPLMLQKSDGGYGYDSTDMAALKYRIQELQCDRIIIITDFTQADHFKMIFQAGTNIGWTASTNKKVQLEHIGFGTVQGEDGKRFKTRSGDTVRLVDLLDEAVLRMEAILRERISTQQQGKDTTTVATSTTTAADTTTASTTSSSNTNSGTSTSMTDDEIRSVAEAIGYGAVKYFDLRRNPTSNYKFSYDQMLSTVGDTAVYIIYTRVRLDSIIAKAGSEYSISITSLLQELVTEQQQNQQNNSTASILNITEDVERYLLFQLLQFTDMMIVTLNDLYPFHICDYLYKVATCASDFVTQCRVLDTNTTNLPIMKSRLLLCYITSQTIIQCCNLLGIRHVQRL